MITREVVADVIKPVVRNIAGGGDSPIPEDDREIVAAFDRGGYYIRQQDNEE